MKIADKVLTPNATPDPTPKPTLEPTLFWTPKSTGKSRNKISSLKLHEKFLNKIVNDEESVNNEILKNYSVYQNQSFLPNYLYEVNQAKSEETVNQVNGALIDLR